MIVSRRTLPPVLVAALVLCTAAPSARAQIMGPPVDDDAFHVGFAYAWFHRDMPPTRPVEKKWEVGSIVAQYGINDRVTVSLAGARWTLSNPNANGADYDRYLAGIGLVTDVARFGGVSVAAEGHFTELADYDTSGYQFHKSNRSIIVAVHARVELARSGQRLALWAGPAYAWDRAHTHPYGDIASLRDDSNNDFGAAFGARALVADRLAISAWAVVAGYVEPRVSASIRL